MDYSTPFFYTSSRSSSRSVYEGYVDQIMHLTRSGVSFEGYGPSTFSTPATASVGETDTDAAVYVNQTYKAADNQIVINKFPVFGGSRQTPTPSVSSPSTAPSASASPTTPPTPPPGITWSSSNTAIASVSPLGEVKGVSVGVAVITVSSSSASIKIKMTVNAALPPSESLAYEPKKRLPLPKMSNNPTSAELEEYRKAIASNLEILPNDKETCDKPQELSESGIFAAADKLAEANGNNQVCSKDQYNKLKQASTSGGMAASIDTWLVKASASMSFQDSSSSQEQKNSQSGCGAFLTNATNISNKQSQMQCIINKVSQNTTASISTSQNVEVSTKPLTPQQQSDLNNLQTAHSRELKELVLAQAKLVTDSTERLQSGITKEIIANPSISQEIIDKLMASNQKAIDSVQTFNTKLFELTTIAHAAQEKLYSRALKLTNATIKQFSNAQMKASISLSASATQQLATLSASIAKDTAAQAIANTYGTSALDPNIHQLASTATQNFSSSASSSITNIANDTRLSINQSGSVIISADGYLDLNNIEIDQNFVATMVVQSILAQSITAGISAAASFLSDTSKAQSGANQIAGLNDLQNALNAGNIGAIKAGNDPLLAALGGGGGISIITIIVIVVVLIILYFLFGRSSSGSGGGMPIIISNK